MVGFRNRTARDESPHSKTKTRLAVARAESGDHEALRFLLVSYSHNVYGYVGSSVTDDHEAEDVTQHVFAKRMTAVVKYDRRRALQRELTRLESTPRTRETCQLATA